MKRAIVVGGGHGRVKHTASAGGSIMVGVTDADTDRSTFSLDREVEALARERPVFFKRVQALVAYQLERARLLTALTGFRHYQAIGNRYLGATINDHRKALALLRANRHRQTAVTEVEEVAERRERTWGSLTG